MIRALSLLLILGISIVPASAMASAFEVHSSWDKEPWLESEKGVSLGMSVLEMGTGFRYLKSDRYFNSNSKLQDAPNAYEILAFDLFWRFGFTDNWTFWSNIPIIWSDQTNATSPVQTDGKIGDCETGILYQFFRRHDPTVSMGVSLRWKLPTGSESPGKNDHTITGTGTTDVDLSFIGRAQLFKYLSLGWNVGYNLRLPGVVQYILDRHTSITNASIDLGDELYAQFDLIGGIKYVSLQLTGRFTFRLPTKLAVAEYRTETVRWENPATSTIEEEEYLLYNGQRYNDWDVLGPTGNRVSSSGFIFTLTPKIIIRPLEWLDLTFYTQFHLAGKNSIYLVDVEGNNSTIDNFMPMQTLGTGKKVIIGELGCTAAIRW